MLKKYTVKVNLKLRRRCFYLQQLRVILDNVQEDCVDVSLQAPALVVFLLVGVLELEEQKILRLEFEI